MKAVIVEDEFPAAERLQQLLKPYTDVTVAAVLGSVAHAVRWFEQEGEPDLVFSDIQLGDGLSFEIYERVALKSPIVFTTSYDEYALRAFRLHSLDYLLKPIKPTELERALEKYSQWRGQSAAAQRQQQQVQFEQMQALMADMTRQGSRYRQRFLVETGEQLVPVHVSEIAYFLTANELVYLMRQDGRRFVVAHTLEQLETLLSPDDFFRLNRQVIARAAALGKLSAALGGRLKVQLEPPSTEEVMVSRERAGLLKQWLER